MKLISLLPFLMLFSDQVQGSFETIQRVLSTGENLTLNVPEDLPKDAIMCSWLFTSNSTSYTICSLDLCQNPTHITTTYKERLVFSKGSVIINDMQKPDSGVYTLKMIGDQIKTLQINITVQDPVSPVNLTDPMCNTTTHECTVTCSTGDFNISGTLRCSKETWHLEGGERSEITNTGASISLYQSGSSIICNHSNNVSQNQANVTTQPCSSSEGSIKKRHVILGVGAVAAVLAGVLVLVLAGVALCFIQKKHDKLPERNCNLSSNLCNSPKQEDPLSTSSSPQSSTPFLEEPLQPVNGRIDEQIALTPLCPSSSEDVIIFVGSPTSQ